MAATSVPLVQANPLSPEEFSPDVSQSLASSSIEPTSEEQELNIVKPIITHDSSKCDLFMEGVRHYNYTELRPLERAQWLECLEMRAIGQSLSNVINIPELDLHDIIYNHPYLFLSLQIQYL